MTDPGHFYCTGCGCDRVYDDAVNDVINGEGLCYRCNKQLDDKWKPYEDTGESCPACKRPPFQHQTTTTFQCKCGEEWER